MTLALYKQPITGIVAVGVSFLSQWLGHSAYTFIHQVFGDYHYLASFLTGVGGAWLIGRRPGAGETQVAAA